MIFPRGEPREPPKDVNPPSPPFGKGQGGFPPVHGEPFGGRHSDGPQAHIIKRSDPTGQAALPPGSRCGLEHSGVLHPGFQGFQRLLDNLFTEFLFLIKGAAGIADGIGDGLPLHDAAGADSLRQVVQGCYEGGGKAGPLQLLGQRSSATRARPSSGCEDYSLNSRRRKLRRHLLPEPPEADKGPHVARGAVEVIV